MGEKNGEQRRAVQIKYHSESRIVFKSQFSSERRSPVYTILRSPSCAQDVVLYVSLVKLSSSPFKTRQIPMGKWQSVH